MKKIILSSIFLGFLVLPSMVGSVAAPVQPPTIDLGTLLNTIVGWLFWGLLFAGVFGILISGFMFVSASGDDAKIKTARQILIYSLVGVLVGGLANALINLVKTILNV